MIDKNERQFFRGQDMQSVLNTLNGTLQQWSIGLQQTGVNMWAGKGTQASYGMMPKVAITMTPVQEGFFVDIRISSDFKGEALVILIVSWLFFFPVALILAYLGYQDWTQRQTQLFQAIWFPLQGKIAQPPGPQWIAPAQPGA